MAEQADRLTDRLGELAARVNQVTGTKVTIPAEDVRGLVEIANRLAAQLTALREENEALRRDLRGILKAWVLGEADKMAALMLDAFLRQFGEAPALAQDQPAGETA